MYSTTSARVDDLAASVGAAQLDLEDAGGYLDPGEDPVVTAAREVLKEAGWRPRTMVLLTQPQPSAGIADFENLTNSMPHLPPLGIDRTGAFFVRALHRWHGGTRSFAACSQPFNLYSKYAELLFFRWIYLPNNNQQFVSRLTDISADGDRILMVEYCLDTLVFSDSLDACGDGVVTRGEDQFVTCLNSAYPWVAYAHFNCF